MSTAICTLAEKDYHFGAAALINSLHYSGFEGTLYYGYRGDIPAWATIDEQNCMKVSHLFAVKFIKLDPNINFGQYKPRFMLNIIEEYNPSKIFFFDSDLVVKCKWKTMELWADNGVALCQDGSMGNLPARHPRRIAWLKWVETKETLNLKKNIDYYFNAGMVGVESKDKEFLILWENVMKDLAQDTGFSCDTLVKQDDSYNSWKENPFFLFDQDALNIALICSEINLNAAPMDGMDFGSYGFLLSHAAGPNKPWRGGFIKRALWERKAPDPATLFFNMYSAGPIQVFNKKRAFLTKVGIKTAELIGKIFNLSY